MIYVDTSFIIPFYLEEATSDRIEVYLLSAPLGSLAASKWTVAEFNGALARLIRMGELSLERSARISTEFSSDIAESWRLLVPTSDDFDTAVELIRESNQRLRPGDALHLAVAKNAGAEQIVSLDSELIEVASQLGISATSGES